MEKLGKDGGESESEDDEGDASESDESEEEKSPPKSQPARTILRAKRKAPASVPAKA